jgi:hypothetical protein
MFKTKLDEKSNKILWPKPSHGKQKGKPKKGQQSHARTKERRKLFKVGSYLTHIPSNVTYMQIMRSKNNKRFRISIAHQSNLPLCYAKAC